jgi:hypothetical protein
MEQWAFIALSAAVAVATAYVICFFKRSRLHSIPGPSFFLPLVGEGIEFNRLGPVRFMYERWRKHGPIFRTNLGFQEFVVVGDPALVRPS